MIDQLADPLAQPILTPEQIIVRAPFLPWAALQAENVPEDFLRMSDVIQPSLAAMVVQTVNGPRLANADPNGNLFPLSEPVLVAGNMPGAQVEFPGLPYGSQATYNVPLPPLTKSLELVTSQRSPGFVTVVGHITGATYYNVITSSNSDLVVNNVAPADTSVDVTWGPGNLILLESPWGLYALPVGMNVSVQTMPNMVISSMPNVTIQSDPAVLTGEDCPTIVSPLAQTIANAAALAVWTPASGKKFRIKGGLFGCDIAGECILKDGNAQIADLNFSGRSSIAIGPFGRKGYLSGALNNVLTLVNNCGASTGLHATVWGNEE